MSSAQLPSASDATPLENEHVPTTSLPDLLASSHTDPSIFTSPQSQAYLTHVATLNLPDLLREPSNLASEASLLTTELTNLCHREYSTFLQVHSAAQALEKSFDSFTTSLDSLLSAVPDLEAECRSFAKSTKDIQDERRKASLVLEHHDKLLDVLEIPQLIDTCVRNGYYQEAMDLSNHAALLVKRFPDVRIVREVGTEVDHAIRLMLAQLLSLLREPVKLPSLFKAVNFLRKMGDLQEDELALAFLTSRMANLQSQLAAIERERTDHARFIRKYVDVFREGVYDVVTQYTTIFLDRSPELRHFLSAFTNHLIASLLDLLQSDLPKIDDPTSLTSILTQLTYCSTSFSRIGLDFRSLLPPAFISAVLHTTSRSLAAASNSLLSLMNDARKGNRLPSTWLATPSAVTAVPPVPQIGELSLHNPPQYLSSFPPLAQYTNALLNTLNTLRLLAPQSLLQELLDQFSASISTTADGLLAYSRSVVAPSSARKSLDVEEKEREKKVLMHFGAGFVHVLVPFVYQGLVSGVYGQSLGSTKSFSSSSLKEWETWLEDAGFRKEPLVNGVNGHSDVGDAES